MKRLPYFLILALLLAFSGLSVAQEELVVIPGTIQDDLGCPGEWQPNCEVTALAYLEAFDVYENSFAIPPGSYEYKVAIGGTWDVNFGGSADPGGPNIILNVPEDRESVTFLYDPATNWVMDDVRHQIVTAPGNYQDEVGCEGEWQPECLVTWLQDIDGDGTYTFTTEEIPAGDYEVKAAIGRSWDENYGAGGEADGANIAFNVPVDGETVSFTYDSASTTLVVTVGGTALTSQNLRQRSAHWVNESTFAWNVELDETVDYRLLYSADAAIELDVFGLAGDFETLELTPTDLPESVAEKFPHLADYQGFALSEDDIARVPELLTGQVAVGEFRNDTVRDLTGVQIPGVLDDLYTYDGPLGITIDGDTVNLTLWAPTAQNVALNLYDSAATSAEADVRQMTHDADAGTWSADLTADDLGKFYTYTVEVYAPTELAIVSNEVTDPYSVSLSQNSTRSQLIDLNDPALQPEGWDTLEKPEYGAYEDISLYELHIRDFSARDESVPEELRGTYVAFTLADSNGRQHLDALAAAGLTHIHLLPSFDIATINENRDRWITPDYDELAQFPPDSEEQQAAVSQTRGLDGFNWGYDPYHFLVPEGSYATEPDGAQRILEYRQMVQALNEAGLRVVQDVVFNHTNAKEQEFRSVLDRVVPGYYHRLDSVGNVTNSTCCANTATEHNMMRRLMIDGILLHTTQYKVDGYRFDLMGHHMLEDMRQVREVVDALTLEADGIDGESVYIYGEGWNFGEVADNARGVNATQLNVGGLGIGTFNDRLRDAVRGGNPFGGRDEQGIGNGVAVFPNDVNEVNTSEDRAALFADQTRVGLAGNLANYTFVGRTGAEITGADVDYNGAPAGYTLDPQENILYVSAHDNETLFDNLVYRVPEDTTIDEIVRMQTLSLSYVAYAQGVPFFHAGSDLLRSKSMDRDSYDSGDWYNLIDWTYQTNNFGVGLPLQEVNAEQWPLMRPVLARTDWQPSPEHIALSRDTFQEMLRVRYSTPLFRLQTAEQVQERVAFHNTGEGQVPGVIVMSIDDTVGEDLDPAHDRVIVVFNGRDTTLDFTVEALVDLPLTLHPILAASVDSGVQEASFDSPSGTLTVPPLTTAVFVQEQ